MEYRCEVRTVAGFIQRVAVDCVARGYHRYVLGQIPQKKDPHVVDRKMIEKFNLVDKSARHRRKLLGLANTQYVRYRRFFVLLVSSYGYHEIFEQEGSLIRDVARVPMKFAGHSISFRAGHVHVRIKQDLYLRLKRYFFDHALKLSTVEFEEAFRKLRFEPYAPIRSQLLCILRAVNCRREVAGLDLLPSSCLPLYRRYPKAPLITLPSPTVKPYQVARSSPALILPRKYYMRVE